MTEPLQPALFDPEQFPNAPLQPVAGPDRRSTGERCVDRTIRISIAMQILVLPVSIAVIALAATEYIAFYWLIVGTGGVAMSCILIVVLLKWEKKRRQDSILKRWSRAQERMRSLATRRWEARRRRNRRPNPQDNPIPVQDESIVEERRVGPPTVAQRTDDSQLPGTSVESNPRKSKKPGGKETPLGRWAKSVLGAKPDPLLLRARHDSRIPSESRMTRQLQQARDALPSISGDVERSDPHTSDVQLPRADLQPSSTSEAEGARHGQSMPTELTRITPQQAVDELATPPILSELAQRVGIPLVQRTRRVTGGGERQDLETLDVQQLANQEQIPQIPGTVHELEGSEDPIQGPAAGPCRLATWDDI